MKQRISTNNSAGRRPEYRTIENIISDATEVMAPFFKNNGDKRLGLERRQYSYDKHIPERRYGQDRRRKTMEPCYEYLACDEKDCIMHGRKDTKRCWEVEGTLCNHSGIQIMRDKLAGKKEYVCSRSGCIYYKAAKERNIV